MIKKQYFHYSNSILHQLQRFLFKSSFRYLSKKESNAVALYDFRKSSPNNKVLITCEHATNE